MNETWYKKLLRLFGRGVTALGITLPCGDLGSGGAVTVGRVWQIDFLRGVAMILMAIFHALVDIRDFFGIADIRYFESPWMYIGKSSAILFMFVSGISCRFSKSNVKRGAKLLLLGMVVTVVSLIVVPSLYIRFGILHFLGSAMIITGMIDKLRVYDKIKRAIIWLLACAALFLGQYVSGIRTEIPFLFPLGIISDSFFTYDFYPLFPWLGVFLAGFAAGEFVVRNRERLASYRVNCVSSALSSLGRVSLFFYLVHQPALFVVFWLLSICFFP